FQYARHRDRYVVTPVGADRAAVFDYTVSPAGDTPTTEIPPNSPLYPPGLGYVYGEEANNRSKRESYGGAFTAYLGNHEVKVGGDYQRDETVGSHYITGGNVLSVLPCLQSGASVCDLSRAPLWTNTNPETRQVFYEHDVLAAG